MPQQPRKKLIIRTEKKKGLNKWTTKKNWGLYLLIIGFIAFIILQYGVK